jgi:N-acetylmuramoyl-L-alanine amidase
LVVFINTTFFRIPNSEFRTGLLLLLFLACPAMVWSHGRRPPLVGMPSAPVIIEGSGSPRLLRLSTVAGNSCLALEDVADWTKGHLHWHPAAHRVNLLVHSHDLQFLLDSDQAWIDGKPLRLDGQVFKKDGEVWAPLDFFSSPDFSRITHTSIQWNPGKYTLWVDRMGSILSPRYTTFPEETRIILEMAEPLDVSEPVVSGANWRIALGPVRNVEAAHWDVEDGVLSRMAIESRSQKALLDLYLGPSAGKPVYDIESGARPALVIHVPKVAAPMKEESAPQAVAAQRIHAIRRIVIDPGHGGKDPGAVSAHGIEEKTINLMLAKELADALRQDDGFEVLMTRMDDVFVPLQERSKLANQYKADLFISIHCNSSLSSRLNGFEVYFLSEKASDPHAAAVARLENASLALEGKKANTTVRRVLDSLVKNGNINEASALGSIVDRQVAKRLSQPRLGVKQAGFYVLRGAAMPAILVETAFLSNQRDEQLLRERGFRNQVVGAIEAAIVEYDQRRQHQKI